MSRQQKITEQDARAACLQLQHEAETTGRQPSVLALSRRLGLANTTLRRRFPDICAELAVRRAQPALPAGALDTTGYETLQKDVTRLRRDNQDLTENLEMAIANIQRLTIENHRLRQALQEAHKVARIPTRRST